MNEIHRISETYLMHKESGETLLHKVSRSTAREFDLSKVRAFGMESKAGIYRVYCAHAAFLW